ncbi:MAG TPA: glycerol kinase GlpK [Egibacteraceae bacterium]|nr:glycerol kinase GlpK [Egibacteraceae bacterium]
MSRILALDSGTTGVTALVLDEAGAVTGRGYREFPQHFPRPGWVEHDPDDIVEAVVAACDAALTAAGTAAAELAAIGITNQRETVVVWDRETLQPLHNAVVWQDRRTAARCDELREAGHATEVRRRTGLVIDAYFSGTKLAWLLDNAPQVREAGDAGRLAFGTVDSWVVARLTGGAVHATDPSNASRTMLYDIRRGQWSAGLCDLLGVPPDVLPEVRPNTADFGTTVPDAFLGAAVPIHGMAGDQQAALFGQGCWEQGMSKNTYGTGSFVLLNTGGEASASEALLTSVGWDLGAGPVYVLEGSIFVTGAAVQWLRDGLGIIERADQTGPLAETVDDTGDVFFVPAFTGLGAPYWDPYARGALVGLTRGTTGAHVARAAVEAMAYQTRDVVEVMAADSGVAPTELRVDGGAAAMDLLCQFQADLLGVPVLRPKVAETTALGAGFLAGLGAGVWSSVEELRDVWQLDRRFDPAMDPDERDARQARWRQALERSRGWATA